MPNFIKSGQSVAEIWRFNIFSIMAAVHHLGFVEHVFGPTTMSTWLSTSGQNLVGINGVVLIICRL